MPNPTASDPACTVSFAAEAPPWLTTLCADPGAECAGVRFYPAPLRAAAVTAEPEAAGWFVGEVALGADRPPAQLFFRPTAPHRLFAALEPRLPASLWVPVGKNMAMLTAALGRYRTLAVPSRLRLPLPQRGFIGHRDSLGQDFTELAAALAGHPAIDPLSWGSFYADDPWPRPLPADLPAATRALLQRHYTRQATDGSRSLTFVTRWSRSLVSLEDHAGALVLSIASAEPVPAAATDPARPIAVQPADAELRDAPADVRWALLGHAFASASVLQERLRSAVRPTPSGEGDDRVTTLLGLAAVYGDDLRLLETLRRIARLTPGDWALRAAAIAIAERHGYTLLLHELQAGETDPELAAELAALTGDEPGVPGSPDVEPAE